VRAIGSACWQWRGGEDRTERVVLRCVVCRCLGFDFVVWRLFTALKGLPVKPDWGAYWTRLAEHQEAAGQHLAASIARREAEYETVPWHQAAHAAASGWP
jgi:hypothetical protein